MRQRPLHHRPQLRKPIERIGKDRYPIILRLKPPRRPNRPRIPTRSRRRPRQQTGHQVAARLLLISRQLRAVHPPPPAWPPVGCALPSDPPSAPTPSPPPSEPAEDQAQPPPNHPALPTHSPPPGRPPPDSPPSRAAAPGWRRHHQRPASRPEPPDLGRNSLPRPAASLQYRR